MLELKNIVFGYSTERAVLNNISVSLLDDEPNFDHCNT